MMITTVKFFSRDSAEALPSEANTGMISITNPVDSHPHTFPGSPADLLPGWGAVLRLEFDDVTADIQYKLGNYTMMTEEQAREILDWLEWKTEGFDTIYVHCAAGISRSAAVAKFIGEINNVDMDPLSIRFANEHVYKLLISEWQLRKERTRYKHTKTDDVFELICDAQEYTEGDEMVVLRHIKSGDYLACYTTKNNNFDDDFFEVTE